MNDQRKLLRVLFIIAAIAALAILGTGTAYYLTFGSYGLSSTNADWGTFGGYLGGTLSPILSFLSLTAVLITLHHTTQSQQRQAYLSTRSSQAQTYLKITSDINSPENFKEVAELRTAAGAALEHLGDKAKWDPQYEALAQVISNRYQIAAHLVERNFISKPIFFESFSGTVVGTWNLCAPYIALRRQSYQGAAYLRRDFERLALQCWLYQIDIGVSDFVMLIDEKNMITKVSAEQDGMALVAKRILWLTRESEDALEQRITNLPKAHLE